MVNVFVDVFFRNRTCFCFRCSISHCVSCGYIALVIIWLFVLIVCVDAVRMEPRRHTVTLDADDGDFKVERKAHTGRSALFLLCLCCLFAREGVVVVSVLCCWVVIACAFVLLCQYRCFFLKCQRDVDNTPLL